MLAVIKHVVDDNIICLSATYSQQLISPELWPELNLVDYEI